MLGTGKQADDDDLEDDARTSVVGCAFAAITVTWIPGALMLAAKRCAWTRAKVGEGLGGGACGGSEVVANVRGCTD